MWERKISRVLKSSLLKITIIDVALKINLDGFILGIS